MTFLAGLFLKFFTSGTLNFISGVIGSLTNAQIAKVQAETGLAATEAKAVVQAEIARINAQSQVQMAQMTHPIWWFAWGLFVIPPAIYDAIIHIKSIGCMFVADAKTCNAAWVILQVPPTIESWDMYVVLSMFGLAVTSSVVTTIANRLGAISK